MCTSVAAYRVLAVEVCRLLTPAHVFTHAVSDGCSRQAKRSRFVADSTSYLTASTLTHQLVMGDSPRVDVFSAM